MFRKVLAIALAGLFVHTFVLAETISAATKTEKEARFALKVRAGLERLGVGEDIRISVKLRDKTKVAGYLSAISEESFTVTDLTSGKTTTVAYPQVKQVKGQNMTTGEKVAIGVTIAAMVIVAVIIALVRAAD